MNRCCANQEQGPAGFRVLPAAGWVLPSTLLALIPKCPMCLAAYIALATGVGLSDTGAEWLRDMLMLVCIGTLFYMAMRIRIGRRP